MEQPSLLLQLSSSHYQLNMAVDYTEGGEEKEREQTEGEQRAEEKEGGRKGDGGRRGKDEEGQRRSAERLLAA